METTKALSPLHSFDSDPPIPPGKVVQYLNLKLAALGLPTSGTVVDPELGELVKSLLLHQREEGRLLAEYLPPADRRIQNFLYDYLEEIITTPRLPNRSLVLDRPGLARVLSLPIDADTFSSPIVTSYRVQNGVLHNPKADRRTTQGIFHVTEGGLPISSDKLAVPELTFGKMLEAALRPPIELLRLPFTATQEEQAACFVSLLIRPIVSPGIPGKTPPRTMEIRFFAPGGLVSNLDFVENIFGNGGDPILPENDAALDPEHWSGHTGCVILAPHLIQLTKKSVGLPHWENATERQRRDGMCWKSEEELYNNGQAFKLTARNSSGVIVTLIADNYFGYCKKEVKTQISFAANLLGLAEEEHAGGALVFASYDLGEEFSGTHHVRKLDYSFSEVVERFSPILEVRPEGYAVDRNYPDVIYVPENAIFNLNTLRITWPYGSGTSSIKLLPAHTYIRPSGYKVRLEKPPGGRSWRLIGTVAEGTFCHKPCTVSGGGKSEISKPITDAILQGPVFVSNFESDFDTVAELLARDYSGRFLHTGLKRDSRPILSQERSLGSVIKLLNPSLEEYTPEYNAWLGSIPSHIKELVFVVKRYYKPEWGSEWREHFSVDIINGTPGNELKCDGRKLVANYLRVGYGADGAWRVFGLRKDFAPATKLQREDDITASMVVPAEAAGRLNSDYEAASVKLLINCERKLFQRPDDAVHRGYDKQTERDFSQKDNFFSNYAPLQVHEAVEICEDAIGFDRFTEPMQRFIREVSSGTPGSYFVCPAFPRIVEGKPSKNPRYLQPRPDLLAPRQEYIAEVGARFRRRVPLDEPLVSPVNAVLPGRRNNPPEPGVRALATFNPIHFLELPELFMEFICSITGKSPSTTGAGSEGALTKGPFNALSMIYDLNNAFVAYALCEPGAFITAAGFVGPKMQVDHDVSLLVPEMWSRMTVAERNPQFLKENGYLEKCRDFTFEGRTVHASRMGWRITRRFVTAFFGRIFTLPDVVFTEEMLRPELQDLAIFVDGMENATQAHQWVAENYFEDGSVEQACPPLKALLHIMARGEYEDMTLSSPAFRALFTRESVLASDWYRRRLEHKRTLDLKLCNRGIEHLRRFLALPHYADECRRLGIEDRLQAQLDARERLLSPDAIQGFVGTIGATEIPTSL